MYGKYNQTRMSASAETCIPYRTCGFTGICAYGYSDFSRCGRLKVATAEIEKSRATRGEIWDGGSTSFSYAWGQLNGEFNKDNELSIEQSLGSFLTPFYKNSLVNSQISTGEYYRNMVKKEIIAEVKRAWTYYLFFYISDGTVKAVDEEGRQHPFTMSLDELTDMLNPKLFFRANRQFLISRKAIKDISLWFNGRLVINLNIPFELKEKIIISKAKASEFKEWF